MSVASAQASRGAVSNLLPTAWTSSRDKPVARSGGLTPEEQVKVQELRRRDSQVRAHELAHVAAGGRYILGGANFVYEIGPDRRQYAVGGDVAIDVSPERDPRDTINKMRVVQRAALAPANPSPQDRAVAAEAANIAMQAQMELSRRREPEPAQRQESVAGVTGSLLDLLL